MTHLKIKHNRSCSLTLLDKTPYLAVEHRKVESDYADKDILKARSCTGQPRPWCGSHTAQGSLRPTHQLHSQCVSIFPLRLSVCLSLTIFVSVCTPKCRLMPCRTDRLNANPWVVPKAAPGSKLCGCVCLCMCECVCPSSYKSMPVCLLDCVNTDIKQLPLVNNCKGHCRFQIVYTSLSCPDEKETFLALMSITFTVSVHLKQHAVRPK